MGVGSMCSPLGKLLVLRHAAACFYLHMWVPRHPWGPELANKRQHGPPMSQINHCHHPDCL